MQSLGRFIAATWVFFISQGNAQPATVFPSGNEPPTLIKNDFTNGYSEWPHVRNGSTIHSTLKYKFLTQGFIYLITDHNYTGTERKLLIDSDRDFSIAITYAQLIGKDKRARFTLSWGGGWKAPHHSITLEAAKGGKFSIYSPTQTAQENTFRPGVIINENNQTQIDFDEERLELIKYLAEMDKPGLITNTIKIEQYNKKLTFFINDLKVYECAAMPWYDNTLGFGCSGPSVLLVDDIHVRGFFSAEYDSLKEFLPQNLGPRVNTMEEIHRPHVSLDGKEMYFNHNLLGPTSQGNQLSRVSIASLSDSNEWIKKELTESINLPQPYGFISMSSDKNTLLTYGYDSSVFKIKNRIKAADGTVGWSELKPLGTEFNNEDVTLSGCFAANGKAVVFDAKLSQNLFYSSDPGKFEHDLFVCLMNEQGVWSAPINLGPIINTSAMEINPVLAPDGRTLYFSKAVTHPGWGWVVFNLFMSRRIGDGWTEWTAPIALSEHIGYIAYTESKYFCAPVYLTIPACGDYGYFASPQEGYGGSDLFRFKIPDELKPNPVVLLKGQVLNAESGQALNADFVVRDLVKKEETGRGRSNPVTGEYITALPYGANYSIHALVEGFVPIRENIDLTQPGECRELTVDLTLVPVSDGASIALKNVFFFRSLPKLKPESYDELDALTSFLKLNPGIAVELLGHTDNVGDYKLLMKLSRDRVEMVKSYLITKGIDPKRISGKGHGPNKPVAPNDTEENRSKNRRVEAVIKKK